MSLTCRAILGTSSTTMTSSFFTRAPFGTIFTISPLISDMTCFDLSAPTFPTEVTETSKSPWVTATVAIVCCSFSRSILVFLAAETRPKYAPPAASMASTMIGVRPPMNSFPRAALIKPLSRPRAIAIGRSGAGMALTCGAPSRPPSCRRAAGRRPPCRPTSGFR